MTLVSLALAGATSATPAAADTTTSQPIPVNSYDIANTPRPGWGGWSHAYDGAVTGTGRLISNTSFGSPELVDYTNGNGTLNDGMVSTQISQTHLLTNRPDTTGQAIRPTVTLHLPGQFYVDSVTVHGGNIGGNATPGALTQLTVDVGQTAVPVAGQPVGFAGALGPVDDLFDLSGTTVSTVPTSTIILRDFTASIFGTIAWDQVSITELTITGRPASAPPLQVTIDVKPGDAIATILAGAPGVTPVAVLSTEGFDAATQLDPASVKFGRTGSEASVASWSIVDVNKDSRNDVLFNATTRLTGLTAGDTRAQLRGTTVTGRPVEASDQVRVIAPR